MFNFSVARFSVLEDITWRNFDILGSIWGSSESVTIDTFAYGIMGRTSRFI